MWNLNDYLIGKAVLCLTGEKPVLVLAEIEFIFYLVAGAVLCFGFSTRIKLITH